MRCMQWRNSRGAEGHCVPPDDAQRENQPTDREKRGVGKREKEGDWGRKEEKKGGKGRKRRGKGKKKKGGKEKKERKEKGKKGRGKERNLVFPKYKINKINQNYINAVYKWVKSDEFLRGVTWGE